MQAFTGLWKDNDAWKLETGGSSTPRASSHLPLTQLQDLKAELLHLQESHHAVLDELATIRQATANTQANTQADTQADTQVHTQVGARAPHAETSMRASHVGAASRPQSSESVAEMRRELQAAQRHAQHSDLRLKLTAHQVEQVTQELRAAQAQLAEVHTSRAVDPVVDAVLEHAVSTVQADLELQAKVDQVRSLRCVPGQDGSPLAYS